MGLRYKLYCAKANKVLGLARRALGPNNSEGVSTAYKTLVRPILEYGCRVWNQYLVKHIKSIESIQMRASSSHLRIRERISGDRDLGS